MHMCTTLFFVIEKGPGDFATPVESVVLFFELRTIFQAADALSLTLLWATVLHTKTLPGEKKIQSCINTAQVDTKAVYVLMAAQVFR